MEFEEQHPVVSPTGTKRNESDDPTEPTEEEIADLYNFSNSKSPTNQSEVADGEERDQDVDSEEEEHEDGTNTNSDSEPPPPLPVLTFNKKLEVQTLTIGVSTLLLLLYVHPTFGMHQMRVQRQHYEPSPEDMYFELERLAHDPAGAFRGSSIAVVVNGFRPPDYDDSGKIMRPIHVTKEVAAALYSRVHGEDLDHDGHSVIGIVAATLKTIDDMGHESLFQRLERSIPEGASNEISPEDLLSMTRDLISESGVHVSVVTGFRRLFILAFAFFGESNYMQDLLNDAKKGPRIKVMLEKIRTVMSDEKITVNLLSPPAEEGLEPSGDRMSTVTSGDRMSTVTNLVIREYAIMSQWKLMQANPPLLSDELVQCAHVYFINGLRRPWSNLVKNQSKKKENRPIPIEWRQLLPRLFPQDQGYQKKRDDAMKLKSYRAIFGNQKSLWVDLLANDTLRRPYHQRESFIKSFPAPMDNLVFKRVKLADRNWKTTRATNGCMEEKTLKAACRLVATFVSLLMGRCGSESAMAFLEKWTFVDAGCIEEHTAENILEDDRKLVVNFIVHFLMPMMDLSSLALLQPVSDKSQDYRECPWLMFLNHAIMIGGIMDAARSFVSVNIAMEEQDDQDETGSKVIKWSIGYFCHTLANFIRGQKDGERRVYVSCTAQTDPNLHERIKANSRSFYYPKAKLDDFYLKFWLKGHKEPFSLFAIIKDCKENEDSPWIDLLFPKTGDVDAVPSKSAGVDNLQKEAVAPIRCGPRTRKPVSIYTDKTLGGAKTTGKKKRKSKPNPFPTLFGGTNSVALDLERMQVEDATKVIELIKAQESY